MPTQATKPGAPCGEASSTTKSRKASPGPASKVYDACLASDAITIEAWVQPSAGDQSGPARIASFSIDTGARNFTLGQSGNDYDVRLRTTTTSAPSVISA